MTTAPTGSEQYLQTLTQELFEIEGCQYVGIVDNQYNVLVSKIRPGFKSTQPFEKISNFLSLTPPIIVDAIESMQPYMGEMAGIFVLYKGLILGFFRKNDLVIVLGFPATSGAVLGRIVDMFKKIAR